MSRIDTEFSNLSNVVPSLEATHNTQIVRAPVVERLKPLPPYMPQAIPEDLAPRLIRLHGYPFTWWIGQFLKYLLKPQEELQEEIDASIINMGFKSPIVG